jgi:chromosome partitioning protein
VNVAAYLAAAGKRSLLIDFDPQASASSALGANPLTIDASIYHGILGYVHPESLLCESPLTDLHYVPAAPHLAGALVELVTVPEREYYLRRFVNTLRHRYDHIFIDLPPSLSLLTVNGLIASDEVLIPMQAEYYSLEGIGQLLQTIDLVRSNMRHNLKVAGALLTMYDKRERLSREVAKNLRLHFPHTVFNVEIPRNVALAEAPSFSKPIALYRPDSPGAWAYERLARELLAQEERSLSEQGRDFGNFNVEFDS